MNNILDFPLGKKVTYLFPFLLMNANNKTYFYLKNYNDTLLI